jgi:predicted HTH domain antitoxin
MAKLITFQYPDHLPDSLHVTPEEFEKEALMSMVIKLYERKRLSSGTAAALLSMDRVKFIMMLKDWNVNYVDYSVDELVDELKKE